MQKILSITIALLLYSSVCMSGWFGPDNYEECVVDKMKGHEKYMFGWVKKACEKKFPFEKELPDYLKQIETHWFSNNKTITLEILKNHGEYTVTRTSVRFTKERKKDLTELPPMSDPFVFKFSSDSKTALIFTDTADSYESMIIDSIWGIYDKN